MSLRSLRSRRESCTYRLNRAAIMRMEEGRRKAITKEGYYGNRTVCIQVDNKRYSELDHSQSNSQSENEANRTEEDWGPSEEEAILRTSARHQRGRKRGGLADPLVRTKGVSNLKDKGFATLRSRLPLSVPPSSPYHPTTLLPIHRPTRTLSSPRRKISLLRRTFSGVALSSSSKASFTSRNDYSAVGSGKPRTSRRDRSKGDLSADKKLRPGGRRKASTISHKQSGFDDRGLNAKGIPIEVPRKRKVKLNRMLQTSQAGSGVHRKMKPAMEVEAKLRQRRPKTSISSSLSSDQQFQEKTDFLLKSSTTHNHRKANRPSSSPKSFTIEPDRKRKSEEEIGIPKPTLLGSIRMEPSYAAETEPNVLPNFLKRMSQMIPEQPFNESLLIKQQKMNEELYDHLKGSKKHSAVGVSGAPPLEPIVPSESVKKKEKPRSGRASSRKRSGIMRPSPGFRRLYFKPLTSNLTMNSDQEEVISKWRKRLGTTSPPPPNHHKINPPFIASSSLRDSHIFRVQDTPTKVDNDSYLNSVDTNHLIPEKDYPDASFEDIEFKNFLASMNDKHSNEVFSVNEEREIFLRMQMEKTKKQIYYLEELAREKLERLEAIRWKKKRALEEEAVLSEKLEKLLYKIQELRESDSFAKLLDKQTQVFSTKRIRPNIK